MRYTPKSPQRQRVLVHVATIGARQSLVPATLDHLPNTALTVAVAPGSRKRIGEVVGSDTIIGRRHPAPRRIDHVRHSLERNQSLPLVRRVPSRPIAALP